MQSPRTDRLAEVLRDPREELDVEVKNWLNLTSDEKARATFAKAALALANHGGGIIILGMTETAGGLVGASGRPATLDGYSVDIINGIIHRYADPQFHCSVYQRPARDGLDYPMVVVPGGHRVPVRAKRGGPNDQIVKDNSIYIRRPGPRSEVPQNAQDWESLLARCFLNRRDEMFDQFRSLLTGAVPTVAISDDTDRFEEWIGRSKSRWFELRDQLPEDAPERCPHGYMWHAFELSGQIRDQTLSEFGRTLRSAEVDLSGWPPFWYPSRTGIQPYPYDGLIECWIGGDQNDEYGLHGAGYADFWRVSPEGFGFLLRGYREDDLAGQNNMPPEPGTWTEVEWPVALTGEIALYIESLADRIMVGETDVRMASEYTGMQGRKLLSIGSRYLRHRVARQDQIRIAAGFPVSSIRPNLDEIVSHYVANFYGSFDFFELPSSLVSQVLSKLRNRAI